MPGAASSRINRRSTRRQPINPGDADHLENLTIFVSCRPTGTIAAPNRSLSLIRPSYASGPWITAIAADKWQPKAAQNRRIARGKTLDEDNSLSRAELDDRIAILQDNLRQLVEQAAGYSGGQTEERNAERIAQQRAQLDRLLSERDGRLRN
jgi:uncharacterized small protein (DUF1192 family)